MIFIELAIAVVILLASFTFCNERGMIPGTAYYTIEYNRRSMLAEEEKARMNLVLSRLRLRESENIDQMLALPVGGVVDGDTTATQRVHSGAGSSGETS